VVATPFLKRRQQVLKPRDSPEITDTLKPSLSAKRGQHRRDRQIGEGSSIRPGSWNEAKAQDGSPGNLGDPAHVHVQANRQIGSPVKQRPGPEGTSDLVGAQAARHEPRRIAWTPEAKQISDRTGVAGSRSTSIVPVTSGNRTHRDPIEERGVPCGESR
jgi:hypothetical protein